MVIVAAQGDIGGAERVLLLLLSRVPLGEAVVCAPESSPLADAVRALGHPVRDLYLPKLTNARSLLAWVAEYARAVRSLAAVVRTENASVIHGFASFTIKVVAPVSVRTGVPAVIGVHEITTAAAIGPLRSRAQRLFGVLPVARFVAVSSYVADALVSAGYPPARVEVVHNGIERSSPRRSAAEARADLGLPADVVVFLVVARLSRWKGVHVAIDAMAEYRRAGGPPAALVIVGAAAEPRDELYAEELRSRADALGIGATVRFTGHQSDVEPYYDACDAVIVPSIEPDPFPTVVLEASLAGRPVLATALGGAREAVVDGRTGFVVDPDPASLGGAMVRAADPTWRAAAGDAARRHAEEHFTVDRFAESTRAVWRTVAEGGPAGLRRRRPIRRS